MLFDAPCLSPLRSLSSPSSPQFSTVNLKHRKTPKQFFMAADQARHRNLFTSHLLPNNRHVMNPMDAAAAASIYPTPGGFRMVATPPYGSPMKSEINDSTPRKRPRDDSAAIVPVAYFPVTDCCSDQSVSTAAVFAFLGEDISVHVLQQQLEIDSAIAQHMETVRVEMEMQRKWHSRRMIAAAEVGMTKRLYAKEEELERLGKLNSALEERMKSLFVENQIWKDLAHANEATANAVRTNLHRALAQVSNAAAESCGDSTTPSPPERLTHAASTEERCWCRNCGKEEPCVLLLPCRHLCLCTACGSSLHACPVCKVHKNASVHVNMA